MKKVKKWCVGIGVLVLVTVVALVTVGRDEVEIDGSVNMMQGEESSGNRTDASEKDSQSEAWQELADYSVIETNDEFEAFYGTPGLRDLNRWGYDASYYRRILQQLHENNTDAEYCKKFLDPVTAAIEQLKLGEGSGVARLKDGTIISDSAQGITISGDNEPGQEGNGQNSLGQGAYFTEGTYAYVTYTFAKDASTVEFPIRLIEGSYGLWSVDANAVREWRTVQNYEWEQSIEERFGFSLEISQYGIYRNENGILTNIYPYYLPVENYEEEQDGIFYFLVDTTYREGDSDYEENMVCMLNLTTGEIDSETLSLKGLPIEWRGNFRGVSVHNGFVHVGEYDMPLINTGDTAIATGYTFDGKPVKDLTEEERDVYSVELRKEILESGEFVKLSNRTMTSTYAYVDLDGDGKAQKISLSKGTPSENFTPRWTYDSFQLQVGDSVLTGELEYVENELWFFSYDGENIAIVLFGYGGGNNSGTVATMMYVYQEGELHHVDNMHCYIDKIVPDVNNGIFYVWEDYNNFVIPITLKRAWKINESNQFERVPQEIYDISHDSREELNPLVPLPVYENPGGGEVTYIQPQKVEFIQLTNTLDWVFVKAADGTSGWMGFERVPLENGGTKQMIKGLGMDYEQAFKFYYAKG